jgi:hypothetical protein
MLTTTLMDYLLQRFINPAFITPKMIVPSLEFIPRMKMQLEKLSKTDRSSQKTISAMQDGSPKFKDLTDVTFHIMEYKKVIQTSNSASSILKENIVIINMPVVRAIIARSVFHLV